MEGFDDDFAPLQSSEGPPPAPGVVAPGLTAADLFEMESSVPAEEDDAPLFLGDEEIENDIKIPATIDSTQLPTRFSPNEDPSSSSSSSDVSGHRHETKEDPEVIKLWKEAQIIKLEAKDREEERAKQVLKLQAKKELEDWYKQHSEQMGKLQAAHRAASESMERELATNGIQHPLAPGTEWERIAKLCDFNPKSAKNTKDVSRMRSVILQLKQGGSPPTSITISTPCHGL